LLVFATWFFSAYSIKRVIAYCTLTIGAFRLMSATGLAFTRRWIEPDFALHDCAPTAT
jgi:hypothetical protein